MVLLEPAAKKVDTRMKLHKLNEDDIMSEFEIIKPYFEEDSIESCSQSSASLNEDIWKKFELLPTPPRSPYHKNEYGNYDELDNFPELQSLVNIPDDFCSVDSCKGTADKAAKECQENPNLLIKDCMWNGVGHRPMSEINKGRWKNGIQQANHPNGCVDPKTVFPNAANEVVESKLAESLTKKTVENTQEKINNDKTETSDSDEEIDVVTVEKPVHKTLLPRTLVGTLVSKQNKLSFVTTKSKSESTTNNRSTTIVVSPKIQSSSLPLNYRGRARNKTGTNAPNVAATTVTMLIDGSNDLTKAVKVHLKPAKGPAFTTVKQCNKNKDKADGKPENKASIMRLATPGCVANGRTNTSTSPSSRTGKKRILSLDGVSFSSTLGHRQYQNNYARINKNYKKSAGVPELISIKHESGTPIATPIKLTTNSNRVSIASASVPISISDAESLMEASFNSAANKRQRICASAPTSPISQKRKRKLDAVGSSSSSGSDNEQIRAAHNVLERQRREGLRTSFHLLRNEVPELQTAERTPKVNILTKARDYCLELAATQRRLEAEKMAEQEKNEQLMKRLQNLQGSMPNAMMYFEEELSEMDTSEDELLTPVSSNPSSPSSMTSENENCKISSASFYDYKANNYNSQVSRARTTSNSSDIQSLLNILKSTENTCWQNSPQQKHMDEDYHMYNGHVKMHKENIEMNSISIPHSLLQC